MKIEEAEPEPAQEETAAADPRAEYVAWLTSIGLQDKEKQIIAYLSVASPLKDLEQMGEEDLEEMIEDEGLDEQVRALYGPCSILR